MHDVIFCTRSGLMDLPVLVFRKAFVRPALASVLVGFPVVADELLLEAELLVEVDVGGALLVLVLDVVVLLGALLVDMLALGVELAGLTFTESPPPPQAARPRGRASRVAVAAARVMTDMAKSPRREE